MCGRMRSYTAWTHMRHSWLPQTRPISAPPTACCGFQVSGVIVVVRRRRKQYESENGAPAGVWIRPFSSTVAINYRFANRMADPNSLIQIARMYGCARRGGLGFQSAKRSPAGLSIAKSTRRRGEIATQTAGPRPDSPSTVIIGTLPLIVKNHPGNLSLHLYVIKSITPSRPTSDRRTFVTPGRGGALERRGGAELAEIVKRLADDLYPGRHAI